MQVALERSRHQGKVLLGSFIDSTLIYVTEDSITVDVWLQHREIILAALNVPIGRTGKVPGYCSRLIGIQREQSPSAHLLS